MTMDRVGRKPSGHTGQAMPCHVHGDGSAITAVADRLQQTLEALPEQDSKRHFLSAYLRTTLAVGDALRQGIFDDAAWVEQWDVAFAERYFDAIEAHLAGKMPTAP